MGGQPLMFTAENLDRASGLDRCAQEPIHIIGHIQPHGVLFALSEPDLIVRQVSANVSALLGTSPETLLNCTFEAVLGAQQFALFRSVTLSEEALEENPLRIRLGGAALDVLCVAHRQGGLLIVELELLEGAQSLAPLNLNARIRLPLSRLELASGIPELSELAAREIRRLSGFDRVMVYRFDEEWNGEVMAESTIPSPVSYLGLRFPASDIPAQARRLFLLNRLRSIVDVDAAPVPIVSEIGPLTGLPLDLTFSSLRSPAPVHLEYLRNMGVKSSLTVSIIAGQQLWGMIACHHASPRHVDHCTRSVCELFGQMLGSQVALRMCNAALRLQLAFSSLLENYLAQIDASPALVFADCFQSQQLLELFRADGMVLSLAGVISAHGHSLEAAELPPVVGRLWELSSNGIASSNMLSALDPGAISDASAISGALYLGLGGETGDYLLLLRRELLTTITWGGNPDKSVNTDTQGNLHPRTSFRAWQETVHARSLPWSELELEGARALRLQLLQRRASFESAWSQQRFRFLADTMPQLIWTAKPDGDVDYYNQRWLDYTGMSTEQSIDWGWERALHPDDLSNCLERWQRTIATECDYDLEYRLKRACDGAYRWHLGRAFPLRNQKGDVVNWVGTATDIEDQKQARYELERRVAERTAELTQAHEKLQSVLDGATNVSIIATDTHGLITLFNAGAGHLFGYTSEEVVGKHTPAIFHLESELLARGLELTGELGKPVQGFDVIVEKAKNGAHEEREWTYVRKAGNHLDVNLVVTALKDPDGTVTGFLGVAMDVSARKRAEAASRASDEHFRLIVESVEDYALIMLDADGLVISWNTGAERINGYTAAEIIGRHFSIFYEPEEIEKRHPDEELHLAAKLGRYTEEGWRVRKDGSRFFANVVIAAIHDEAGKVRGFAKVVHDITERKRTEERFQLVVEASPSAMIMVTGDGLITLVNSQTEKLFGYARQELLGRPVEMLLPERFRGQHGALVAGFFSASSARAMGAGGDLFGVRKDGSEVPVEISLNPIDGSGGKFVLASIIDITQHKMAEKMLRDQALILDLANDSILIRDSEDRVTYWNQGAESLYGWNKKEALGQVIHALLKTHFPQPLVEIQEQLLSVGHWRGELVHTRRDGSLVTVACNWTLQRNGSNRSASVLEVSHDITARKQAEDQLKISALRLSLATAALQAGVWDWDIRTNVLVGDERMYEIYGLPSDMQVDYEAWRRAVLPDDLPATEAMLQEVIATKSQASNQFRIMRPDGSLRYIQAAESAILDDSGQVVRVVGINIDTTGRKFNEDLEQQVADRTAQLKAANYELEQFAYVASHDLKAPLRAIHNSAKWLEEDLAEHLTGETREHLTVLRGRVTRMEKLLDDLLEYASIGRSTDNRYAEIVKGDLLMENVLALLYPEGFTVEVSPGFANIEVYRMPLQQILMNLIGNAIKHHHKKTGKIAVTVETDGDFYAFAVKDDGPGISAQFHDQIFEMFRTLRPRDQVEGSGMGLAMVRKHINICGGTLRLESAPGRGSTFRFTWPKRQQLRKELE
jgi:PAS domain S-box-containing protein